MYPTVVVVLVETQRSMMDICEIGPSNASQFAGSVASRASGTENLGRLSFAVGSVRSTTDNGAESQCPRAVQSQGGREHCFKEVILEVKENQVGTSG